MPKHSKRPNKQDHQALVRRAVSCAARVLPYFEKKYPKDQRPRQALAAGRAWVRGKITVSEVRAAAFAAHAAARNVDDLPARAAARAAGHAAATVHVVGHARHAVAYAAKAKIFSQRHKAAKGTKK
jgi:hypothetical protein